ncbi:LOW QUALITY PROTEIN: paxillin homolog 1 [Nilaparvata lugens]|uniref:LOW QUALITY PROTEIN: paxillin homolog 1 n=1 Tax=Nilaparvata lugens TaxID=108931 RepID=UPI00193E70F6|nr:LOW QUALITY PROTEIN: paxillin homolog 1 [Nilaparvata lugens]
MNTHYHSYGGVGGGPDLVSPSHSPGGGLGGPDGGGPGVQGGGGGPYGGPPPGNQGGPHPLSNGAHFTNSLHQHPLHHHHHHHHHHHMNNNNNNNSTSNNNNNQNCAAVKVCAGCNGKIVERFLLHALDRYWHNSCLKCSCCGCVLAEIGSSCFTKAGMILCKNDYIRMFGNSGACSACGQTIPASEFVMRAGGGMGGQGHPRTNPPRGVLTPHHVFHLKCFACSKCGAQLMQGDRYYLLAGSLVCEQDWQKLLKGSAAAQANAAGGTTTVRKGKVGRPRRSRD